MTQSPKHNSPWMLPTAVPRPLKTTRFVTEPLNENHAEADFAALMSCRVRLRRELQWGSWPPEDFTLELNREDLRGHYGEFTRGEAFAYTVLNCDRTQCLGCVYIERCPEVDGAQLAFWVIDDAVGLELFLVTAVLAWIHQDWSISRVLLPVREANVRALAIAHSCRLVRWETVTDSPLSDYCCFLSDSHHSSGAIANAMPPGGRG